MFNKPDLPKNIYTVKISREQKLSKLEIEILRTKEAVIEKWQPRREHTPALERKLGCEPSKTSKAAARGTPKTQRLLKRYCSDGDVSYPHFSTLVAF